MRSDLEHYVASLKSRRGDDGSQLVVFPHNYQQVLSLMSERDVRDEDAPSPATGADSSHVNQQNWSRVLLQAGLSKQQAFGALDDDDGPSGGESGGMAAKIALKMARVRQLDAVLEEKLGKSLYAATPKPFVPATKGKGDRSNPQEPSERAKSVIATQSGAGANERSALSSSRSSNQQGNFVERNREVIARGMKAVLSSDEAARLDRLMRELESGVSAASGSDAVNASTELVAAPSETTLIRSFGGKAKKDRVNIIHAAKEERLHTQRLECIEREIQFLRDNERVAIVTDDGGESDGDGTDGGASSMCDFSLSDGAASECSFATSVSSTRSGVISRRQFRQFIAAELLEFKADEAKASPDAIRQLVASLAHLTSRPVA
ncbi:hypothetical protein PybrP1_002427 [[Pythium] brassicae (nom. inval.)]|nr:hypothetical protein PybrP1_002427 [[Pythium] brassicae (nom. inval.)]